MNLKFDIIDLIPSLAFHYIYYGAYAKPVDVLRCDQMPSSALMNTRQNKLNLPRGGYLNGCQ